MQCLATGGPSNHNHLAQANAVLASFKHHSNTVTSCSFFFAAAQVPAIRALVAAGASIAAKRRNGCTALHEAAWNGQVAAICALAQAGSSLAAVPGSDEPPPLHWAAQLDNVVAIRALVAAGAPVDGRMHNGSTALHEATYCGKTTAMRVLLELGSAVNGLNGDGSTPLHLAGYKVGGWGWVGW